MAGQNHLFSTRYNTPCESRLSLRNSGFIARRDFAPDYSVEFSDSPSSLQRAASLSFVRATFFRERPWNPRHLAAEYLR